MNYQIPCMQDPQLVTNNDDLRYYMFNKDHQLNFVRTKEKIILKSDRVCINKKYPQFCCPEGMEQYVVWSMDNKMGHADIIKNVSDLVNAKEKDYILWKGKKTNQYYNLILRNKIFNKISLRKLIIIARHSFRTPLTVLPKLEPWYEKDIPLTEKGKVFCEKYGRQIKDMYGDLLFNKDKKKVCMFYSSNTLRTIDSARHFVKGFNNDVKFDFHPIIEPVLSGDQTLAGPIFFEHLKSIKIELIKNELMGFNDVDKFNMHIFDVLGFKIINISDYYDVHSTLECYNRQGIAIPKKWTHDDMKKLERLCAYYYYKLYSNDQIIKIFTEPLTKQIDKFINESPVGFVYMSTHDSMVYPLALKYNKGKPLKVPDFCSSVRYEVWDQCIRIYYDDLLLVEQKNIIL
ncbi:MAG: histidine phosphatase domain-containing protein [Edafosvirus sp.]|uniref:Histidine phosphatase domain-containing protein n=1 Tax=Edafosvirus sp. TaxID=2487765 RepID=A0A3G4ZUS4_9VIRU|nr:MAG: histidine phosphatase domain-containing protein [Edafosvirus sp.]